MNDKPDNYEAMVKELQESILPGIAAAANDARELTVGANPRVVTINMQPDFADALVRYVHELGARHAEAMDLLRRIEPSVQKVRQENERLKGAENSILNVEGLLAVLDALDKVAWGGIAAFARVRMEAGDSGGTVLGDIMRYWPSAVPFSWVLALFHTLERQGV